MFFFMSSSWTTSSFLGLNSCCLLHSFISRLNLCRNSSLSRDISSGDCWFELLKHLDMSSSYSHSKIVYRSLILGFFCFLFCHEVSGCLWELQWLVFLNCKFMNLLFKSNSYVWSLRQKSFVWLISPFFCLASHIMYIDSSIQCLFEYLQIVRLDDDVWVLLVQYGSLRFSG